MRGSARETVDVFLKTLCAPDASTLEGAWSNVNCWGLKDLVRYEQCELWLYRKLKAGGIVSEVDPQFVEWLEGVARRTAATNSLVDETWDRVSRVLVDKAIPVLPLKGMARRLLADQFPLAGARRLSDLDILVPEELSGRAWDVLISDGCRTLIEALGVGPFEKPLHLDPLVDENGVSIEIHWRTQDNLNPGVSWERMMNGAKEVEHKGCRTLVPSCTEIFWHGLHHSIHTEYHAFLLRYLLDGAALALADSLDMGIVRSRIESGETDNRQLAETWLDQAISFAEGHLQGIRDRETWGPLLWSINIFRRFPLDGAVAARLVEESRRVEYGFGPAPLVVGAGLVRHLRRRVLSTAARTGYRCWRLGN